MHLGKAMKSPAISTKCDEVGPQHDDTKEDAVALAAANNMHGAPQPSSSTQAMLKRMKKAMALKFADDFDEETIIFSETMLP